MKVCPICHSQVAPDSNYCTMCGNRLPDESQATPPKSSVYQNYYQPTPVPDPWDHTAEFDAADVSEHKLYAMLMYLTSIVGIIVALLAAKESAFVQFHLKQNLKLFIVEILLTICGSFLAFTFIVPIAAVVCVVISVVLRAIAFFQVCSNKSKEPAIIRGLNFLK